MHFEDVVLSMGDLRGEQGVLGVKICEQDDEV